MKFTVITLSDAKERPFAAVKESVAAQDFPAIEHIVVDPEAGAINRADALNQALRRATGDVIGYLDPGDRYERGAVSAVMRHFLASPRSLVAYGRAAAVDERGGVIGEHPTQPWNYLDLQLRKICCRAAIFWRREAASQFGVYDERFGSAYDYEYWLRAGAATPFDYLPGPILAATRDPKSAPGPIERIRYHEEVLDAMSRYAVSVEPLHVWMRALARCVAGADRSGMDRTIGFDPRHARAYADALLRYGDRFQIPIAQDELSTMLPAAH